MSELFAEPSTTAFDLRAGDCLAGMAALPAESLRQVSAGQHIAGNLFNRELIERQVVVERRDDPVAVGPDRT